jgi:hypothetical protein
VARLDLEIVERADDFQSAEHAEHAVVFTAGRLGVEMAADHDRRQMVLDAGTAGEHIAHLVDLDRATFLLAPGGEEVASLFVEIGEGEALAAAFGRRADLGHFHQSVP